MPQQIFLAAICLKKGALRHRLHGSSRDDPLRETADGWGKAERPLRAATGA
jgi:hypothetical protein